MKEPAQPQPKAAVQPQTPFFVKKGGENSSISGQTHFFHKYGIYPKLEISDPGDEYEKEADRAADTVLRMPDMQVQQDEEDEKIRYNSHISGSGGSPGSFMMEFENRLQHSRGSGNAIPGELRAGMERKFGSDFSRVRLHTGEEAASLSKDINARAFTHGNDIFFGNGKSDFGDPSGKHLLAHELTHVSQQSGSLHREMIQRDLAMSLPTANGGFEINMTAHNGATDPAPSNEAGMDGSIRFLPATTSPYSNEIKLIQIVRLRDTSGADIEPASVPTGRGTSLRTAEDTASGVEGGFFTDVLHQNFDAAGTPTSVAAPGVEHGMAYEGGTPVWGFKRSDDPADIKAAELQDTPGGSGNFDFDFETVAKGEDTQTVYGGLNWGFGTRNGNVVNERVNQEDTQSSTFDAALERHRDFYVHEKVIFYFGFDSDNVTTAESDKIDTFLGYLRRFPDVLLLLQGFADRRGNMDYNIDLSRRREDNVKTALIAKGIDASKISTIGGWGATEEFTSGNLAPDAGRSQDLDANRRGNRRVELSFTHSASYPVSP